MFCSTLVLQPALLVMMLRELRIVIVAVSIAITSAFLTRFLHKHLSSDLRSVKRRPDRFTEWEVRKKGESNSTITSAIKSSIYRNSVADSKRIADSTSLTNRRIKPSAAPSPIIDYKTHEDYETGLVIERLGGSLLVEISGKIGSLPYNVVCYQRSSLCDSIIVVGDTVDLLIITPSTVNSTVVANTTSDTEAKSGSVAGHINLVAASTNTNIEMSSESPDNVFFYEESAEQSPEIFIGNESAQSETVVDAPLLLQGVVLKHHDRLNLLQRPSPFNSGSNAKNKAIAANIDQIVLVVASIPVVPMSSIDRILVAANEYDMDAIILLNKMDLEGSEELFNSLKHYERMGYPLLRVSVKSKEGLQELKDLLKNKCSVFVGQSGIGKSSLVNTLLPNADYKAKIGALVRSANLGAHTTSSARLFHIPEGGKIIDSPGIRELGLWHLSESSIKAGFREIDALTNKCKFRNCRHTADTFGCAVQEGIRDGVVSPDRLESYFSFLNW